MRSAVGFHGGNPGRVYAFYSGGVQPGGASADPMGPMVVNYWDGSQWSWADQGGPSVRTRPAVITYRDGVGAQRLYAFAWGRNGHLHVNYWDGSQWRWADQGQPSNAMPVGGPPTAITYLDSVQRMYVFVRGTGGALHVNYWNGSQWQWANQGGTVQLATDPAAITYPDGGTHRIYIFVNDGGALKVNWWDGSQWRWATQGGPPGITLIGSPSVTTYRDGNTQFIHAFMRGGNGRLYVNFWNGSVWQWADQGTPSGTIIHGHAHSSEPRATTCELGGVRHLHVFVLGDDRRLHVNWWNGSGWQWVDLGRPAGMQVVWLYDAITYVDGVQRWFIFAGAAAQGSPAAQIHSLRYGWDDEQAWRWVQQ
jgi:hypothetical protein